MSSQPQSPIGNGFRFPSSEPRVSSAKRHHLNQKESMNGPLYRQTCNNTILVRRIKRKGNGPSKQLARWFVENQIGMPYPISFLSLRGPRPRPRPHKHKHITPNSNEDRRQAPLYEIFFNAVRPPPVHITSHCMMCVSRPGVKPPHRQHPTLKLYLSIG